MFWYVFEKNYDMYLEVFLFEKKTCLLLIEKAVIHYLKNKVGVVDFANAQGLVMF